MGTGTMPENDLTTLDGALNWIRDEYPMIAGGLIGRKGAIDNKSLVLAARVYALFINKVRGDISSIKDGLESFAQMSFDFIKLQSRFMRVGHYEKDSAKELLESLYDNPTRMEGFYLDGLLLTYSFWPNHVKLLCHYIDFLKGLTKEIKVMEIGVGHGLLAHLTFEELFPIDYTGLDISASSVHYAQELWRANGGEEFNANLKVADATREGIDPSSFDLILCCEVLEHVEEPSTVLKAINRSLKPDGKAFITTVANIAAEDHIYLFHDVEEIRGLCNDCGLTVIDDKLWALGGGFEEMTPIPLNYSAVLVKTKGM